MSSLAQDLDMLRELSEQRNHAKKLREEALRALKKIDVSKDERFIDKDKSVESGGIDFRRWVGGNDSVENDIVELALLVRIQNHRDISEDDKENNKADASPELEKRLKKITLKDLIQLPGSENTNSENSQPPDVLKTIPVLTAARVMQALVSRAETVFEPATMYCYYRIIRELYGVAQPNWTVGAARAGVGGTTSAFVTNECIRAIFSFENVLRRTYEFFDHIFVFYEKFSYVDKMLQTWGIKDEKHPLYIWANKTVEAMWLDCYLSTNPRKREIGLFWGGDKNTGTITNALLLPDNNEPVSIRRVREYFESLPGLLKQSIDQLFKNVAEVYYKIDEHRKKEEDPHPARPIDMESANNGEYIFNDEKTSPEEKAKEDRISKFHRTATAHEFALKVIEDAIINANLLQKIFTEDDSKNSNGVEKDRTKRILEKLYEEFYRITRRVHRVLEPSKQYVKWVLNRELAASSATFDAGELVFAAMSYGVLNHWRLDDKLTRACELLITTLPDTGRLPTKRPFHSTIRGYRTLPIGCEMTRALANLLQKTGYDFDGKFVGRMVGVFDDNRIELSESTGSNRLIAWNFEGSPSPDKPALWVTAISVLALDRIVRMLNARINEIVLAHFDVTDPEHPHTSLTLHDLIYSDYGLAEWYFRKIKESKEEKLTAISLQQMRAHIMRATLPEYYLEDTKNFSPIFYGPPGTGKTTLAESLALSASAPLLRLSPSDLILQGQELIEGRARDVFEALSMLTQCVIIFDEFEPVLKSRSKGKRPSKNSVENTGQGLALISDVLWVLSEKDDPKFRFVLGGMLPKFIKLHDTAEKQSFAYCLGTNYLNDIDDAAKRPGRFDKRLPVYKPDVLSRAGLLLYRLSQTNQFDEIEVDSETFYQVVKRFIEVVARTTDVDANRINKLFKVEKNKPLPKALQYIFEPAIHLPEELTKNEPREKIKIAQKDIEQANAIDDDEKIERQWLLDYENKFAEAFGELDKIVEKNDIVTILDTCLQPPTTGAFLRLALQHQSRTE